MKSESKWVLIGLPILAVLAIIVIQAQMGGVAPAPPMSIPDQQAHPVQVRTAAPQPTVLAPADDEDTLPPGSTAGYSEGRTSAGQDPEPIRTAQETLLTPRF